MTSSRALPPFAYARAVRRLLTVMTPVLCLVWPALGTAAIADARTETPFASGSAQTDVAASLVRLHAPLPKGVASHPAACDWIQYVRFRPVDGPADPMRTDAVSILMPGFAEGAMAFDPVARNTIREARRRGRQVEVWALDRRANCLEDLTGLQMLERTGDTQAAVAYYYGGLEVDGRRFGGYRPDDRFLADLGIEQTVQDMATVLQTDLPDQAWREQHAICGGHSLAGQMLQAFASWDLDGNPATTDDAGYRQCAGFLGFDANLDVDPAASGARTPFDAAFGTVLGLVPGIADFTLRKGGLQRHTSLFGIGPESLMLLESLGWLAAIQPDEDAGPNLDRIPRSRELDTYYRLGGSPDLAAWVRQRSSLLDLPFTNEAFLGQLTDDNTAPLGLVRASVGYPTGAPLRRNRLPEQVATFLPGLGTFIQRGHIMFPQRLTPQPTVRWRNYDELGTGTEQEGRGVTTPASEVTDIRTFARILYEGPTNFTEAYFPTRLGTDLAGLAGGNFSDSLAGSRYRHGTARKPRLAILAEDGVIRKAGFGVPDPSVVLPGYDHLDVVTAAETQNDGRPEGSSQAFADFIDQVVPVR